MSGDSVFGVFGDGNYRLQPIHVEDFAGLAVQAGGRAGNETIDAIGPESFTYRGLATAIGAIIGCRRPIVSLPPFLGYWIGRAVGAVKGDVVITREEIRGLMDNLLYVDSPPTGKTKLTDWARANRATLGLHYTSELARRRPAEPTDVASRVAN